ncbi:MAG: glycosyltransferase family 4 protein [Minisyncoccia bacterium]
MDLKFLYIYKWCTFGGVERVLINRALAFRKFGFPVKADVFFFYGGIIQELKNFLNKFNLSEYLKVVEKPDFKKYDFIVSIDTIEAFEIQELKSLILEYHTPYEDHASYLFKVPAEKVKAVIVPSQYFKEVLRQKRPDLYSKSFVVRNFVIDDGFEEKDFYLPNWSLVPLVWIGRTDSVKNPHFIVDSIRVFSEKYGDKVFFCVVGSSQEEEIFLKKVESLRGRVIYYPNIKFERVKSFLKAISKRKGIFVSASKGESFGMAVAEAIYFGLPVLISDIPPHKELVKNKKVFLFKLSDINDFCQKLNYILENYDILKKEIMDLKENLEAKNFIKDWQNFLNTNR